RPVTARLSQATFAEGVEAFPAWSPDGLRLAFARELGRTRAIVVAAPGADGTRITRGPYDEIQPAWSPDGTSLVFVRARVPGVQLQPGDVFGAYEGADLWRIELESGRETRLTENAFHPSFAPDGRALAVDAAWAGPPRMWAVDD